MMKCFLYANGGYIGWAEFAHTPDSMGCTLAPFHPDGVYSEIQPVVREFTMLGFKGDRTTERAEEIAGRFFALDFVAKTEDGEVLEPQGGVSIEDFSEELDEDPYQVTLLGLPRETSDKYFSEASHGE